MTDTARESFPHGTKRVPCPKAGIRNTVILRMPDCGIRSSGVVIGKTGDTRLLNWVSLFYGHSAFTVPNREKYPKKLPKGDCAKVETVLP